VTALELLRDLEARGVQLHLKPGDRFAYVAPEGALAESDLSALREHKGQVLGLLRARAEGTFEGVAGTSLWALDRVVEVEVPWHNETLFFSPGPGRTQQLEDEGISRGRVWCTCELLDLLLTGVTPEDARAIAEAKLAFGGATVRTNKVDAK